MGINNFFEGMLVGFIIWVGFTLTNSLNTLFEGKKLTLLFINNGLYIITYLLFAGLISVFISI